MIADISPEVVTNLEQVEKAVKDDSEKDASSFELGKHKATLVQEDRMSTFNNDIFLIFHPDDEAISMAVNHAISTFQTSNDEEEMSMRVQQDDIEHSRFALFVLSASSAESPECRDQINYCYLTRKPVIVARVRRRDVIESKLSVAMQVMMALWS